MEADGHLNIQIKLVSFVYFCQAVERERGAGVMDTPRLLESPMMSFNFDTTIALFILWHCCHFNFGSLPTDTPPPALARNVHFFPTRSVMTANNNHHNTNGQVESALRHSIIDIVTTHLSHWFDFLFFNYKPLPLSFNRLCAWACT